MHLERGFHVGHGAARSHEKVLGTNLHHAQVVLFEKLLDNPGFRRRRRKARRELGAGEKLTIMRRGSIVKLVCQSIELAGIVRIQPDTDVNDLSRVLASEALRGKYVAGCVVCNSQSTRRKRWPGRACEKDYSSQGKPNHPRVAGIAGRVDFFLVVRCPHYCFSPT